MFALEANALIIDVNEEKLRAQDTILGHPTRYRRTNRLGSNDQLNRTQSSCSTQPVKENTMINGIECFLQVNKHHTNYISLSCLTPYVVP